MESFEEVLLGREDAIAAAVVDEIRASVSQYGAVPTDAHRSAVERHIRDMMLGFRERRTPSPSAVDHARWIGRERARQGIPREEVLEAYLIAFRVIWAELLRYAKSADQTAALAERSNLVWEWNHRLTNAVSGAFDEELRRLQSEQDTQRRRLVAVASEGSADLVPEAAAATGMEVHDDTSFIGVACAIDTGDVADLTATLNLVEGVVAAPHPRHGDECVVILRSEALPVVLESLQSHRTPAAGVGHPRRGAVGLVRSVADGLQSLELARERHGMVEYSTSWFDVLMRQGGAHLEELLSEGLEVARSNPIIAETVRTYLAEAQMSLKQSGVLLNVHPNTVKYRVARWETLTGWSTREPRGIAASWFAVTRARLESPRSARDGPSATLPVVPMNSVLSGRRARIR